MEMNKINKILAIINIVLITTLILFMVLRINFFANVPSQNSNALLTLAEEDQNLNMKEQELKKEYNIIDN